MVRHLVVLVIALVSECDEELSTREGEEVVRNISLNVVTVPNFTGLALCMNLGDVLVEV